MRRILLGLGTVLALLASPLPATAQAAGPVLDVAVTATPAFSPDGDGVRDRARVRFTLDHPARVVLEIRRHGLSGPEPLVQRERLGLLPAGAHSWRWDGRADGETVPDALYEVTVEAVRRSGGTTVRDQDVDKVEVDTVYRPGRIRRSDPVVYPRSTVVRDHVTLTMPSRERWVRARLVIRDPRGRAVFERSYRRRSGYHSREVVSFDWTARRDGEPLPAGTYTAVERGQDRAGNRGRSPRLEIAVSADPLVWQEVSRAVRPADGRAYSPCPIHGGTGPNGCADPEWQQCGTVVPSSVFPDGGLSHRSAVCPEPERSAFSFAGSQHLVRFPEAVRGIDAIRVAFTGAPTVAGETDTGTLLVGDQSVVSGSGGSSDWEQGTAFADGYRDPNFRSADLPPSAYWDFRAYGEDSFDVATFTLDVRYLAPDET